jgi:hypothetical protein
MEVLTPPRNEQQIINAARDSGMFMKSMPSKRAEFMRHFEILQQNAEVRHMQDRRRAMQDGQRTQLDYERILGEQAASTIPPLRTFRHQMNDRRRIAEGVANHVNDPTGQDRSDRQRMQDANAMGGNIFDFM